MPRILLILACLLFGSALRAADELPQLRPAPSPDARRRHELPAGRTGLPPARQHPRSATGVRMGYHPRLLPVPRTPRFRDARRRWKPPARGATATGRGARRRVSRRHGSLSRRACGHPGTARRHGADARSPIAGLRRCRALLSAAQTNLHARRGRRHGAGNHEPRPGCMHLPRCRRQPRSQPSALPSSPTWRCSPHSAA